MVLAKQCAWVMRAPRRQRVLHTLSQPMTASQCAQRTTMTLDACKAALRQLAREHLTLCLNVMARCSRVYGLTPEGMRCQRRVRIASEWPHVPYETPLADWELYGWVCFRHRAAVLRALGEPGPAATIRRRARDQVTTLRMSVNNVRDVLRHFKGRDLVQVARTPHRRRVYALTETGTLLRSILLRAEGVAL